MGSVKSWREVIAVGDVIEFRTAESVRNYIYIGKPNSTQEIGLNGELELLALEYINDSGQGPLLPEETYIRQLLRCTGNLRWEPVWQSGVDSPCGNTKSEKPGSKQ